MFNRKSAFQINFIDPDNLEDKTTRIDSIVSLDGMALVFKSSGIFRLLSADTIDPSGQALDTKHSYEKLYSIGANNSWVARMILQFKEILPVAINDVVLSNKILNHVWQSNKLLLNCESAHYNIYKGTMGLMPKCDEIIEKHKKGSSIPALPKVPDLEKNVEHFLNCGKLFLCATYELLSMFYGMPFNEFTNTHFDSHRKWVADNLGESSLVYLMLNEDKEWIKVISEARNALQHPQPKLNVEIVNFRIQPGNKFSAPAWRYDLTKRGIALKSEYSDLVVDFNVYLTNFLTFFEELLLLCLKDRLQITPWEIFRKTDEQIDPKCPIVYYVGHKIVEI